MGASGRDEGEGVPGTHDLVHPQKQAAADHSRGMEPGEILFLKSARFKQHHGKRIAEGEHDGRAGGRREVQRTGFLLDVHVENDVGVFREA